MKYLDRIQSSIEYIEKNLEKDISLEDLAKKAFLSKFHYHRIFRSATGESFAEYVRKRRLTEAANDLVLSEDRVVDIALKYQFNSQEAFARAFKRHFGISPGEYRKTQSRDELVQNTATHGAHIIRPDLKGSSMALAS